MSNFLRLGSQQAVASLMLGIERRPELWKADTYLRDYPQGPFGEVESIMLRFPVKGVKETQAEVEQHLLTHDPHESVDCPAYSVLTEARSLVMGLFAAVQGERLGRVMINKIKPGGVIYPHADTPTHAEYYSRFHLVLQSAPGVKFRCGDEWAYWETGAVFWFNNKLEHEVLNESGIDRIHMIVDARCSK